MGTKKGARSACEKTCYVLNDWIYANDIKDRFNQKVSFEIPDIPVQYWNYEEQIDYALSDSSPWKPVNLSVSDKIAFILYPEVGKHEIVLQHVKILLKNNYKIFVKQRRKSQGISKEIISHDNVFPCFGYRVKLLYFHCLAMCVLVMGQQATLIYRQLKNLT
ncbi:MAG TPA: hypothetical protein EYQ84_08230 [Nitrospinaceae bacterium]|nr:hypothetical protein [Nitrospinaceae bacterium]